MSIHTLTNKTLFLGNGINISFGCVNWNDYIKCVYKNSYNHTPTAKYDSINRLPFNLRIVAASKDNVNANMKDFASQLYADVITENRKYFLQKILKTPGMDIITTNYSMELEQAAEIPHKKNSYYKIRNTTKECTEHEQRLRLYTYFDVNAYEKRIWHIHGDITAPSSIIMGHYYYGKLLREIQNYVPEFIRRYKACMKTGETPEAKSWVDLFLMNDIHMLGFSMNISEMDLWWLVCCKKRNFPNTKIFFHTADLDMNSEEALMMEAYNIDICKDTLDDTGYLGYYEKVLNDITYE